MKKDKKEIIAPALFISSLNDKIAQFYFITEREFENMKRGIMTIKRNQFGHIQPIAYMKKEGN